MRHTKINIFLVPTDSLGGAEKVLNLLAHVSASSTEEVHVIIASRGNNGHWRDLPPNVILHYMPAESEKTGIWPTIFNLLRLSRRFQVNYAISSHTHMNALLGVLRGLKLFKCQRLIFRESTVVIDRFTGLYLALLRLTYFLGYGSQDLTVCQTNYMHERLRCLTPSARRWNLKVIENPIDVSTVHENAKKGVEPSPLSLSPYIVVVARQVAVKGVDVMLKAFALLSKRYPHLRLVLVGNGPENKSLQTLAQKVGCADRVRFLGYKPNPHPYLANAEVAVIPSRIEGFPNTLLEAMSLAPRVVCTLCAGDIEKLDGIWTCRPNDPKALAKATHRALQESSYENIRQMRAEVESRTPAVFWSKIKDAAQKANFLNESRPVDMMALSHAKSNR